MVVIEMENGKKIELELYPEIAPITCENFEKLVKQGFYNGLIFHRVIPVRSSSLCTKMHRIWMDSMLHSARSFPAWMLWMKLQACRRITQTSR